MADRPNSFNTNTPAGGDSPRSGDDEIRRVKRYTQNAYNDLTQPAGVGISRTNLFGSVITAETNFSGNLTGNVTGNTMGDHQGTVGAVIPNTGSFTTVAASGDVTTTGGNFVGPLTGDVTGNVTGDVTGNASTASQWQTARQITLTGAINGSVTIDGSDNVSLDTTIASGSVQPGAVEEASRLTETRTITLDGDVTGSVGFNGASNVTINTTVTGGAADSINGVTSSNAELNLLDLASGTQLGIMSLEAVSEGDPVIGDFSGNITIIGQY